MRIKTIPRHRMLENSVKTASASRSSSEESDADEKDYDSKDAIDGQNLYQVDNYVIFSILLYIVKLIFI